MEIRRILGVFVVSNLLSVLAVDFHRENVTNSRFSNELEEFSVETSKNDERKMNYVDVRPDSKMNKFLLESDNELTAQSEDHQDNNNNPMDEGNKKILSFGKRVFESILRHGVKAKDARLIKSGKYRIDWWKKNRRLQAMRKRLAEALEKNPEMKLRLHSLGWRNNSEDVSYEKQISVDHSAEMNTEQSSEDDANGVVYKILIVGFETAESDTDAPMKVSLSTIDQTDPNFGATTSDFGVVSDFSEEMPTFNEAKSSPSDHSGDQVMDSDRILQLIPLVVAELREGQFSEEERRVFRWIFGKRLWLLLERESLKDLFETMDHELAKFLFKGELPGREQENSRRGRHQSRKVLVEKNRKVERYVQTNTRNMGRERTYNYEKTMRTTFKKE